MSPAGSEDWPLTSGCGEYSPEVGNGEVGNEQWPVVSDRWSGGSGEWQVGGDQ